MIRILEYPLLDSTNLEARRLWQGGEWDNAPFAVVAAEQSGGMGRDGRSWNSPTGGLWMTLAWPCHDLGAAGRGLALAVGLAVREGIFSLTELNAAIKWPNDLLIGGRKISGILCQADSSIQPPVVFIGIGVNANLRTADLGKGLRTPATTLKEELGKPVRLALLRDTILTCLSDRLTQFGETGLGTMVVEIDRFLAWKGEPVAMRNPGSGEEVCGRLAGIDAEGRAVIEVGGKRVGLISGELRLMER